MVMTRKKAMELKKRFPIHTKYMRKSGERLPGATTISALFGESSGGLIRWAYNLGLDEINYDDYMSFTRRVGTLAHILIMDHITGNEYDLSQYSKEEHDYAQNSVLSYLEWEKGKIIKPFLLEKPLVSEKYGFGGTPDMFADINGQYILVDFKSGSGIYPSHFLQTAAYRQLVIEAGYNRIDKVLILNIPRTEDESFVAKEVSNLDVWWKMFLTLLETYKLYQKVTPKYKKQGGKK